jgi:hypothetical protein
MYLVPVQSTLNKIRKINNQALPLTRTDATDVMLCKP